MEAEVSIRAATADDIAAVLRVQHASPGAACWQRNDYEHLAGNQGHVFLVAQASNIVGFLAARLAADELEILNLAVEPQHRRRGVGARLLQAALAEARQHGARNVWLEVRASNQRARAFYRRVGLRETYRRPRFYQNPEEDAVVCQHTLKQPPAT